MEKKKESLFAAPGGGSYRIPFILITSLFLLWGFAHGLLDVLNKHFQGAFTMSKAESGLVQFSTYIAYFLMALPAGAFMKRYGYKRGIIMGLLLFALGAFAFVPAAFVHSAVPFLVALFVIACGLCFLETAANPYSSILGPAGSAARRLNLSQSFNGLGWILGPLVGGHLIFGATATDGMALAKPYLLIGCLVLLVALLCLFTRLPEVREETIGEAFPDEESALRTVTPTVPMWRCKQFVRAVVAQFCYCAAQTGIFSFFINYVTEADPTVDDLKASRILAFGGMALFMAGRLGGSLTMRWLAPRTLLATAATANIICMALVVAAPGTVSLYALYLSFFFMSIMFPTIFALGLEGMGVYTKRASSFLVMGVAGGAFSPLLMGHIGETEMATGFLVPLFAFLYILYFAIRCK